MSWIFQGWEPIIILLVILLIFGPTKLPQLARGLGQALWEFKRASQGLLEEERKTVKKLSTEEKKPEEIDYETLKTIAKKLGIEKVEGKSKEELVKEIVAKAKEKGIV